MHEKCCNKPLSLDSFLGDATEQENGCGLGAHKIPSLVSIIWILSLSDAATFVAPNI